jgi:hypothetical protein
VNLHRFRHAAATTLAIHDPERVFIVKDLLHHKGDGSVDGFPGGIPELCSAPAGNARQQQVTKRRE